MSFEAEADFRARESLFSRSTPTRGEVVTMLYRAYKQHYGDCQTVPGSYDRDHKTVDVIVPDGRIKPSGVRGERYRDYRFCFTVNGGDPRYAYYKAVNTQNAERRFLRDCRREGWTPCEPPHKEQTSNENRQS